MVLEFLETEHENLVTQYLEFATRFTSSQSLHTKLALAYLEQHNENLCSFLESSKFYRAEIILPKLGVDGMYEERAILLSRLRQHDQVLNIYILKLNNSSKAEKYCLEICSEFPGIYKILVDVCLSTTNNPDLFKDLFRIMKENPEKFDPQMVLNKLPADISLSEMSDYLKSALEKKNKDEIYYSIYRNIISARYFQIREKYNTLRERSVKITEVTICAMCGKRIESAFVASEYRVLHYQCWFENGSRY